jgi:hypothetical protein
MIASRVYTKPDLVDEHAHLLRHEPQIMRQSKKEFDLFYFYRTIHVMSECSFIIQSYVEWK